MKPKGPVYGLLAEFEKPLALLAATRRAREHGYRKIDAYTPYPVHGLADALEFTWTGIPLVVLVGGIAGCVGGYLLQYWVSVHAYPLNIGGRPLHSWPSFIPVTFETTVLIASLSAVFGMLALNGLPKPYHPLFNVPAFDRASQDRFFLCIKASDPLFDPDTVRRFLESQNPHAIHEVPR